MSNIAVHKVRITKEARALDEDGEYRIDAEGSVIWETKEYDVTISIDLEAFARETLGKKTLQNGSVLITRKEVRS